MCYLHLQLDNKNFGEETLSNLFINHKNCPECGGRIKGYYYYCGQCGSQNVVNWKHTGIFLLIAGTIFLVAMLFFAKKFCANPFFSQVSLC